MEIEDIEVSFDAVVPSAIFFNENLEPAAIKCYAIIRNLTRITGYCYATNKYLAQILKADESSVKRWISSLRDEGFLDIETDKTGIHWTRRVYLSDKFKKCLRRLKNELPPAQNRATPSLKMSHILEDKKKEEEEIKKKNVPDAEASGLAAQLLRVIKITKENIKEPDIKAWAEEIERMIRIDKRDPVAIGKVIGWLPQSGFWAKNILSADKLRKQFDRLEIEMATERVQKTSFVNKKHRDSYDPTINAPKPISKDEQLVNLGVLFGASKPKDLK